MRTVAEGEAWLDPSVTGRVLHAYRQAVPAAHDGGSEELTAREFEVLRLVDYKQGDPVIPFASKDAWAAWLDDQHATSTGPTPYRGSGAALRSPADRFAPPGPSAAQAGGRGEAANLEQLASPAVRTSRSLSDPGLRRAGASHVPRDAGRT